MANDPDAVLDLDERRAGGILARAVAIRWSGQNVRDAIATEDKATGEMNRTLTDRIRARRKAIPRRETLTGVADEWQRNMPPRSRLAIEII